MHEPSRQEPYHPGLSKWLQPHVCTWPCAVPCAPCMACGYASTIFPSDPAAICAHVRELVLMCVRACVRACLLACLVRACMCWRVCVDGCVHGSRSCVCRALSYRSRSSGPSSALHTLMYNTPSHRAPCHRAPCRMPQVTDHRSQATGHSRRPSAIGHRP